MSEGKPQPKSGLRRPQSFEEVDALKDGTPDASVVSPQPSPSGKLKVPIKAPSSGMVQLTRVAHASRCQVVSCFEFVVQIYARVFSRIAYVVQNSAQCICIRSFSSLFRPISSIYLSEIPDSPTCLVSYMRI